MILSPWASGSILLVHGRRARRPRRQAPPRPPSRPARTMRRRSATRAAPVHGDDGRRRRAPPRPPRPARGLRRPPRSSRGPDVRRRPRALTRTSPCGNCAAPAPTRRSSWWVGASRASRASRGASARWPRSATTRSPTPSSRRFRPRPRPRRSPGAEPPRCGRPVRRWTSSGRPTRRIPPRSTGRSHGGACSRSCGTSTPRTHQVSPPQSFRQQQAPAHAAREHGARTCAFPRRSKTSIISPARRRRGRDPSRSSRRGRAASPRRRGSGRG